MSSVLVRNGAVLVVNGAAISYQGTEYVINATKRNWLPEFNLASVGLTTSDLVTDESTYFWVEPTANISTYCYLDGNDDDDFSLTIPSGTKFMGIVSGTNQYGKSYVFSGQFPASFGVLYGADDYSSTSYISLDGGWFAQSINYAEPIGQLVEAAGDTNWALHVVKIDSSSSSNLPSASGVSF